MTEIDLNKISKESTNVLNFMQEKGLKYGEILAILDSTKGTVMGVINTQHFLGTMAQISANFLKGD